MLRPFLLVSTAILVALGAGVGSAALLLRNASAFPDSPGWHALPDRAASAENPYRRDPAGLRFTPSGRPGEKSFFVASRSNDGALLRRDCAYALVGFMPASRIWTISVVDRALAAEDAASGLSSSAAVWEADGRIVVQVGAEPRPGNWLPLQASGGGFLLLAAFYASPSEEGLMPETFPMPAIGLLGCRSGAE